MRHLITKAANHAQRLHGQLDAISSHIARSLLGRMVSLQNGTQHPAHGVVAGVLVDNGTPKIVVNGACYKLDQVLTVTPLALN